MSQPQISIFNERKIVMKLKNVLIVANDLERSKAFYKDLFGLDVLLDNDDNVILTEGLVLQDAAIWKDSLERDIIFRSNAAELYFEETDIVNERD